MSVLGKVAIIGMGPMGLMLAHFAKAFSKRVTIFGLKTGVNEKMAGRAAGGMLAPAYECFGEYNDDFIDFALKARHDWDEISKIYKIKIDDNAIAVADNEKMAARLEQMAQIGRRFGLEMAKSDIPFGIKAKQAIKLDCDALLDPFEVLTKTHLVLSGEGIKFCFEEAKEICESAVKTENATHDFDHIIIAAGYNSIVYSQDFPILKNLVPIRGQTLLISHPPDFKGSLRNETTYLMSRGNCTAVGATAFESADWDIHENEIAQLSLMARNLMPDLSMGQIIANFAGIRPQTNDGLPILGLLSANIWFAGGAYRNGWLLAPRMARILIDSMTKGTNIPNFMSAHRFQN